MKQTSEGKVGSYRKRFVAEVLFGWVGCKGYGQMYRIDYDGTFVTLTQMCATAQ
jgi:hypothetical protein